ncbi:MAG: hypothetical protein F4Y57_00515 [Acidobacteria bacterium]|nr:hypothetical protein [Acidobacteriota bacterium]
MSRRDPSLSTPWLRRLPALVLLVLAVLAATWSGGNPAVAADAEAPGKPAGLRIATEHGSLDVALDWDDVDGAARYWVRWRAAGSGEKLNEGVETTSSEASIRVAGYGQWVARVQACNDAGCGKPLSRKFLVEQAPEPTPDPAAEPELKKPAEPARALRVSISANPASPEVNQYANLNATISNIPSDSGAPSYSWQIQEDGGWQSVWSGPTFSFNSNSPTSIAFRLTVSYESGIADTSEPLTVTWTGDPPPVLVDVVPEAVIETLEVASADCELAPPEAVSALGVARAAVAFWQAPSGEEACEPVGYLVEARSLVDGRWRSEFARPEARSHVLDGLPPGQIEYHVTTIYPRGGSERPLALPQSVVPEACNITLTVAADVDSGISGTWTNVAGSPTGCVFGPEIEFQFKQSTWDHFRTYGRYPNSQRTGQGQDSFIAYDLTPGITYDFKIVAVDAAGRKNESNVASAAAVYDADAGDPHSPLDVRVVVHNRGDAYVTWEDPATAPSGSSGQTLTKFVVETVAADFSSTTNEVDPATANEFQITGLTDGSVYAVRVAARWLSADGVTIAWSAPTAPFTALREPVQVWFLENYPFIHPDAIRLFSRVEYNVPAALTVCSYTDDGVAKTMNCPVRTLVHQDVTGDVSIRATSSTEDGATVHTTEVESEFRGPRPVQAHASGGNGTLLIAWGGWGATGPLGVGTHDAWIVQHRKQNADETWPDWPSGTVLTDTTARSHTFSGLANGTWQVRVRARTANVEDHDGNPLTPDQTVHRLGFTSEIQTVTLDATYTAVPGLPTGAVITPGVGSLIVEWEPPTGGGSAVYAYQVRHRRGDYDFGDGGGQWRLSLELHPRTVERICRVEAAEPCENPRRYEITNLIGGRDYDVALRARNANGWGKWLPIGEFNLPNGFPPVLQSAAVNGATVTLTFDRSLDTDSVPSRTVFSVSVNGAGQTPTAVGISGSTVTLTLGTAVTNGQTVTVSYVHPPQSPLQHNDAPGPGFSNQPVTNNTP